MKSITLLLIGSSLGALAQIDPLCAMPSYGPFKIFAVPLANSSAFYPMTLRDLPGLAVVGYPVTSVLADCSECTYKPYDWFLKEMVLIPDFTDREVLSLPVASNSKLSFVTKPSEKPKNNQNYCAVANPNNDATSRYPPVLSANGTPNLFSVCTEAITDHRDVYFNVTNAGPSKKCEPVFLQIQHTGIINVPVP